MMQNDTVGYSTPVVIHSEKNPSLIFTLLATLVFLRCLQQTNYEVMLDKGWTWEVCGSDICIDLIACGIDPLQVKLV